MPIYIVMSLVPSPYVQVLITVYNSNHNSMSASQTFSAWDEVLAGANLQLNLDEPVAASRSDDNWPTTKLLDARLGAANDMESRATVL